MIGHHTFVTARSVLFIGFSFSDEYINELRSATVSLLGSSADQPFSFAIINDKSACEIEFFKKHEHAWEIILWPRALVHLLYTHDTKS